MTGINAGAVDRQDDDTSGIARGFCLVSVEQDSLGGMVAHFPRRKLGMTQPANLVIVGKAKFKEISK